MSDAPAGPGRRRSSRACAVLGLLSAADLLVVLVTGRTSLLGPVLGSPVDGRGFVARAVVAGLCLWLWSRPLAAPRPALRRGTLLLLFLLLPTLVQFQLAGGRVNGDGIMYYVYVRSLMKDGDVDLTNEYTHYGLITRGDIAVPTRTGLRRSIFSIGPALVGAPWFALGEGLARAHAATGAEVDLSGYGPHHRNAVALGNLLYGFLALFLMRSTLERHFRSRTALGAVFLVWGTTFLHWYLVQQPTMSHAPSAFAAALVVWLWLRRRPVRAGLEPGTGPRADLLDALLLGAAIGLAMCVRWQNGVLLVLPGLDLAERLLRRPRSWPRSAGLGLAMGASTLLAAFPQSWAWKVIYGEFLLPCPPHGCDFLRLGHPFVLETFFSSRHGLFSWTPVFWLAYLGFLPLLRRRPRLALPLLVPLGLMTYVNLCSGDWWAGGSFSNRRFDSLLPVLAFGLAASVDVARSALARRPELALCAAAAPFLLWNTVLVEQVRRGHVPRDDTYAFPRLVGTGAAIFSEAVGSPTTWPASWVFAWRHSRPPGQYDRLVGRYLFYRQNNLGGRVEVGAPGDEVMLGEGWGPVERQLGFGARALRGRARLFAPLDVAEDLDVRPRLTAPEGTEVTVEVNGREVGRVWAGPAWDTPSLRVVAPFWRRELNEVALRPAGDGVRVDVVDFARVPRAPGGRP